MKRREIRAIPVGQHVRGLKFSPDGEILAYGEESGKIGLLDFASGKLAVSFQGQHSGVSELLFSRDGRTLFSGAGDSTIMQWDATGRFGKRPFYVNLIAAWDALAGEPKEAYPARWDFLDSPREAITVFRRRVRPITPPPGKVFQRLVADLDSSFSDRQKADAAIKAMGLSAEPLLRKQLKANNSLEARRRWQALYEGLMKSSTWRRTQAVVAIAAATGCAEARHFLEELAQGDPSARLTLKAKEALAQLGVSAKKMD